MSIGLALPTGRPQEASAPEAIFESVWSRSALASGSSSSVEAESVFFSSRI